MSEHKIAKIYSNNVEDVKEFLDSIPHGQIVGIFEEKCTESVDATDELIFSFFEDPKIGFVYTDIIVEKEGIEVVAFLKGNSLPETPFYMKNLPGLTVEKENLKSNLMKQIANQGYYFEHIAEPLFRVKR